MLKWLDKYEILDPAHMHDLDRRSAMYELHQGIPKEQAAQLAFNLYKREQMCKAAAAHLDGMSRAKMDGSKEDEKSHYALYSLHCQGLGVNPMHSILPEITAHRGNCEVLAKFAPHPADVYVLNKESGSLL